MARVVISSSGSGGGAPSGAAGGSLAGTYPNPTIAAGAVTTTEIADGTIVSGDLSATAGITSGQLAGSIAPSKITGTAVTAADTGTVTSAMILDGTIVSGDLNAAAGITSAQLAGSIAPSKITGTAITAADSGTVTNAMLAGSIAASKVTGTAITAADTGTVTSAMILDGTIAGGDLNTASVITQLQGQVGGLPKIVIRTADSSTISSNATPANDDTLLWAVGASDRWFFQAFLTFTGAAGSGTVATEDVKVAWSVPTGGAMQWGALGSGTNLLAGFGGTSAANAPLVVLTAAQTLSEGMATGTCGLSLAGYYTGSGTAGNVNLQWSQDVSNGATLLIGKNSHIMAWRIA